MFRPGLLSAQDAADLNRMMQQLASLGNLSVAAPLSLRRVTGGQQLLTIDTDSSPRLFKITSGSNPYAADEQSLDEATGTYTATGYSVTVAGKAMWEVNSVTTVAAGTIVEAFPNEYGFYFDSGGGGGSVPYADYAVDGQLSSNEFGTPTVQAIGGVKLLSDGLFVGGGNLGYGASSPTPINTADAFLQVWDSHIVGILTAFVHILSTHDAAGKPQRVIKFDCGPDDYLLAYLRLRGLATFRGYGDLPTTSAVVAPAGGALPPTADRCCASFEGPISYDQFTTGTVTGTPVGNYRFWDPLAGGGTGAYRYVVAYGGVSGSAPSVPAN